MKTLLTRAVRRLALLSACLLFSVPVLAAVRLEAPEKAAGATPFWRKPSATSLSGTLFFIGWARPLRLPRRLTAKTAASGGQ